MGWMGIVALVLTIMLVLYYNIAWYIYRKKGRLNCIPQKCEVINLGSTYAYYGFDYDEAEMTAYNLAMVPQYLPYDYLLLQKYAGYLCKGAKVLILLPDFVFCVNRKQAEQQNEQYYMALKPREILGFQWKTYFHYRLQACREPFTHERKKREERWNGYVASLQEKEEHAVRRVHDWETNFEISCVNRVDIPERLKENIEKNKEIVLQMIDFCIEKSFVPIIITMPKSELQKKYISKDCCEVYLEQPIQEILAERKVTYLNYTEAEEFTDIGLYMNSDCFNEKGRKLFTQTVLSELKLSMRRNSDVKDSTLETK